MKRSLNLMSEQARKRGQVRRCFRFWSRVLLVVVCGLMLTGIVKWRLCQYEFSKQAAAEAEYEPIRELKKENGRLKLQIQSLQDKEAVSLKLAENQPLLGLIGMATQIVAQQQGEVYLRHFEVERELIAIKPSDDTSLSLEITGVSTDGQITTRLVEVLRQSGPFSVVELTDSAVVGAGENPHQSFAIQCTN